MVLAGFDIKDFRNIQQLAISPHAHFNLIYGPNGSGKTSILEAIHYLAYGRSFRTSQFNRLISLEAPAFQLVAKLAGDGGAFAIGVERQRSGDQRIRMAGEDIASLSEVAAVLPIQFIDTDSHRSFASGPKYRRKFIDWGLFHVEQSFLSVWRAYQRLLKQRNAALKQGHSRQAVSVWDAALIENAKLLDSLRKQIVEEFGAQFVRLWNEIMPDIDELSLTYHSGWAEAQTFEEALAFAWERDCAHGYTHVGPHRADLKIKVGSVPAWEMLSQGQQKVMCYALRLAQGDLLSARTMKHCIYLVDDLPAELDDVRRQQVANKLAEQGGQVYVTGVSINDLEKLVPDAEKSIFDVQALGVFV